MPNKKTISISHRKLIQKLRGQLKQLEQDILQHDQALPQKESKLLQDLERFNNELFYQSGSKLAPCITQLRKNIDQLEKQLTLNLCIDTINLTCEKIQDRFTALRRALATTNLSVKDAEQTRKHKRANWQRQQQDRHQSSGFEWIAASVMQNSHQLYDELNKHLNWARKIEQKIAELQSLLENCASADKIGLQQNILAMHRRLGKCNQAISYIEQRIQMFERPSKFR